MTATTKDMTQGVYRIGEDAETPMAEFQRTESGISISSGDGNPIELTVAQWKELVNTMGYHGGPSNEPRS